MSFNPMSADLLSGCRQVNSPFCASLPTYGSDPANTFTLALL